MHHPIRILVSLLIVLLGLGALSYVVYRRGIERREIMGAQLSPISAITSGTEVTHTSNRVNAMALEMCQHFYHSVCKRREITVDPTGHVQPDIKGEVEALRLYETIIHEHQGWSNEEVDEELVKRIYTDKRRKQLQEIYDYVSTRVIKLISRQSEDSIPFASKAELIGLLKKTRLELPPPASVYANEPDLYTKNEVYFETLADNRKVIRVGGAYLLSAKSWFNRVFTFSHEIAHSIDPCEVAGLQLKLPGYDRLLRCFNDYGLTQISPKENGCSHNNPSGEAFADWVAAQITAEAIKEYQPKFKKQEELMNSIVNAVRDLCNQETWLSANTDSHPDPDVRIGGIFGNQPLVQELLGCSTVLSPPNYCTFKGKL